MNLTDSGSVSVATTADSSTLFRAVLLLISTPLIALTILGNTLVILTWIFHRPIRTPQNAYFISLAIVDLLTGLFPFPLTIAYSYTRHWNYGLSMCRTWLVACFSLYAITAYHLVVIAADRYRTLTEGISYLQKRTFKSVLEKIAVVWIIGLWVTGPIILDWEHTSVDPTGQNHCLSKKIPYWVNHVCFTSYGFPAFIIIRIYWEVYREIKSRFRIHIIDAGQNSTTSTSVKNVHEVSGELTHVTNESGSGTNKSISELKDAKIKARNAREKRSAITLGIIIGAFLICWAPWYLLTLYSVFVSIENKPSPYLFMFSAIFGLANSCINPIVYAARIPEFQDAVKNMYTSIRGLQTLFNR